MGRPHSLDGSLVGTCATVGTDYKLPLSRRGQARAPWRRRACPV